MNHEFIYESKTLSLVAKNLSSPIDINADLVELIQPIFDELAPFLELPHQMLYIRDIKAYAISGIYPGGNTYVPNEVQIAVPQWPADRAQLTASIAHELHHLVRWQHAGYGKSLGQAVLTEGVASFYEELRSGWSPPWSTAEFATSEYSKVLDDWKKTDYNHAEWFFDGPHGKWAGYALGYQLASKVLFAKGFDLAASIKNDLANNALVHDWLKQRAS